MIPSVKRTLHAVQFLIAYSVIVPLSADAAERAELMIRAFIPKIHPSTVRAPIKQPTERPVIHEPGDTMVIPPASSIVGCFMSDQRGFSKDPTASSRVQASAVVGIDGVISQSHPAATTKVIDCGSGEPIEEFIAKTDRQSFGQFFRVDSQVTLQVRASSSVPALSVAPDIDFSGTFTVDFANRSFQFVGKVDNYPAYEAYARFDEGEWIELFTRMPRDNASAMDLLYETNVNSGLKFAPSPPVPNPPAVRGFEVR